MNARKYLLDEHIPPSLKKALLRRSPAHLQEHLAAGQHVPGIFILRRQLTMKEILEELTLIWEAAEPDEYCDALTYLPL